MESQVIQIARPIMWGGSGEFQYVRTTFAQAGQASFFRPPAQDPDLFEILQNINPIARGILERRWGYALFNNPGTTPYLRGYEYLNDTTGARRLLFAHGTNVLALNEDGTLYSSSVFTPSAVPRAISSRGYAYFYDGVSADLKKWDGSSGGAGITNTGIVAAATAISVGAPVAGAITLTAGRKYYCVFKNGTSGHISDLNPVSASTGPITAQNIPLSNLPVSSDAQVTVKEILATADGGDQTTLYFVAEVANATTAYTDNTPETSLITGNLYQETDASNTDHGVANNTPPPAGTYPIKHRGRMYVAKGSTIYFSKNLDEVLTSTGIVVGRYEECWPATNFFDVSTQAETVRGMFSDGEVLYIGTERHIRRVYGDGPQTFQEPEIVFNELGVLNQDVWKVVYMEGTSVGSIWMTPDFRVIQSDLSTTYRDIGTPVQDVLNTANTNSQAQAFATFYSSHAYDLYLLAIPTGTNTYPDTLLVYDLRSGRWLVWQGADNFSAMLFNVTAAGVPQLLAPASTGKIYKIDAAYNQDRVSDTPSNITSTVQTTWFDMGDPSRIKLLNELELSSGDTNISVTVYGANNDSDFTTPVVIGTFTPIAGPITSNLKVYLASSPTKYRYYRLKFISTGTSNNVLDAFKLVAFPLHTI